MCGQRIEVADGFHLNQEVELSAGRVERVVATQRQRALINEQRDVSGRASQRRLQFPERRGKLSQILTAATVAKIRIVRRARTAHEAFGLAANYQELHSVPSEQLDERT